MSKRQRFLEAQIGSFIKEYGSKAHPGSDPNDRSYDRDIERMIKRMSPEEFDELLNGKEDNFGI
jgi:hypothetical protein